ncbi:hypothetical protein BRSPCE3_43580 [Bradyrhizobium sp. Ce-3]|nr:hypothetical protein BRSPCE3_43580 [Bradyrhizobium sp. Ce-3]
MSSVNADGGWHGARTCTRLGSLGRLAVPVRTKSRVIELIEWSCHRGHGNTCYRDRSAAARNARLGTALGPMADPTDQPRRPGRFPPRHCATSTTQKPPCEHGRPYEAWALPRAAIRSRRRRFLSRLRRSVAVEGAFVGTAPGVDSSITGNGGGSSVGAAAGRASMTSMMERPLSVIRQPPLSLSTRPCEKMSRPGARAANLLVRSAQSRPLVARIATSRLRSTIVANPSG